MTRATTPWHPAWRSAPLLGTEGGAFCWLAAEFGHGQPLVCMRTLLAAMRLAWGTWGGTVRVLARATHRRALRGLSPRGEPSLLLPAAAAPLLLDALATVLLVQYPAGSHRVRVVCGFWGESWKNAQADADAAALAQTALRNAEETPSAPANEAQATPAAPATPGALLRAVHGRYFLRSSSLPELRDAARRMRRMGHSWMQIGRQLGVSKATARRLVCEDFPVRRAA